ncbi:MAG: Bug family tripartite tricarboxylate transporter substrate binding protein, partial [Burkholderiales bacterium]
GFAASPADTYPDRPVRMIVGFPPGGGTDIMSRIIAPKLTEAWHEQIVIDNRIGATGTIGATLVARANPDGYTLLMGHLSSNAIAPSLFKVPYDPAKDFAPISLVGSVPHVLVVHPSVKAHSVKDVIAAAKAKPGELKFPSAGNGTPPHLAGELFKLMTGVDMQHVPYKGSGQSVADLIAGHVPLSFDSTPTVLPYLAAGRLRAIAVTTLKRSPVLPNVPTLDESGLKGYQVGSWYGMFAPAGTPPEIVRKIHATVQAALKSPDMKDKMAKLGTDDTVTETPEAFRAMLAADIAKYAKVIKAAHLKVD